MNEHQTFALLSLPLFVVVSQAGEAHDARAGAFGNRSIWGSVHRVVALIETTPSRVGAYVLEVIFLDVLPQFSFLLGR